MINDSIAESGTRGSADPQGLVDLLPLQEEVDELEAYGNSLPPIRLSARSVYDLEMIASGGFSPLDRFMGQKDHQRVLEEMRLLEGHLFPIPITLPVDGGTDLRLDHDVALRDERNELLAVMTLDEVYRWDRREVASKVFATHDPRHPLVSEMDRWGEFNISGALKIVRLPKHDDFSSLRLSPTDTRARLSALGEHPIVAFQTRNPLHRAHEEMTKRAIESLDGVLLLHPAVGMTMPGDMEHYTRIRTYKALAAKYYDPQRVLLALLPLAMRLAGPREALWHAIIRRNYGANFLIIGRNHASPGVNSEGEPFYAEYAAQALVERFSEEIGVGVVPFDEIVYLPNEDRYEEVSKVPDNIPLTKISGADVRGKYLDSGRPVPNWLVRPEVAQILAGSYPARDKQGVCIWFTGLSGAGKSTTARMFTVQMLELGRQVTLLDGDIVRTHLSKGLGFSKEDRDTNVRRIGYVAAEVVRHGGVAVCAAVSPYRATRNDVRNMIGADRFIEVFVDTPLEVCESRDTKGLYARARRGLIEGFTGIDGPFEEPSSPELTLDTVDVSVEENTRKILSLMKERGFIGELTD